MNTSLLIGTRIVILALIGYSVGIFIEQRKRQITKIVIASLTIGVIFDIAATAFMIIGSPNDPFTLHGFLGYSALAGMLIDTILAWRFFLRSGEVVSVPKNLHIYSRIAYSWWVIAFVSGGLMVMLKP